MKFTDAEPSVIERDIANAEASLGIDFPPALRALYLSTNGGCPEPYVFQNENVDTVVAEFLPLQSENEGTALNAYERLVANRELVPLHFFPFAVDGGGDVFFVDCSTSEGRGFLYRHDTADCEGLLNLGLSFDQFWLALKIEQ